MCNIEEKVKRNNTWIKCQGCSKPFSKSKVKYVKYNNGYYELDCFRLKMTTKKRSTWTNEMVDEYINDYLEELNKQKQLKKEQDEQKQANMVKYSRSDRDELDLYLKETYELTKISTHIYRKIASITQGKDMSEPISYEDLLFIFKRKQGYLNKVYQSNVSKGKVMNAHQRLNYDLSVVVSLYDEYKKWKREKEIVAAEKEIQEQPQAKIDYFKLSKQSKANDSDDLSDMLDDLY